MNFFAGLDSTPGFLSLRRISFAIFLFAPTYAVSATHDVTVGNNFFSPNDLTIEVGDTVRWTNNAGRTHDVTADDGSFASETSSSFVFSRTFASIEEVLYHCSVHSRAGRNRDSFMNGRINVTAADSTDVSVGSIEAMGGSHEAGEALTVKANLTNNGTSDSGMFNIDFFISTDTTITNADILIGTESISNIAAGTSTNFEQNVVLPGDLTDGDYYIGAIIDLVDESSANNTNVDPDPIFVFTEFVMNGGLNDAWFYPITDGQGFFITVFPELGVVVMAWFTYDTELPPEDAISNLGDAGSRWMTGVGAYTGNQAVLNIELTSGGLFNDPTPVQRTDPVGSDGTLTLTFNNCNSGTLDFDITSIDASGSVPIQRVALDNVSLCDALLREIILEP